MMILSDRFWKRLSYLFGLMAIAVFFSLAICSASIEIKDLDLWLHIGMGRFIAQHGYVPAHDVLSCAIAGKPWVNHEWLFQLLVYQIQRFWGFDGLVTMQSLVVVLTFFVLLLIGYRRDRQWMAVFMMLLVLMVYQTRFTTRPDIFSLLFLTTFIYVLLNHIHRRWALYLLVIVQVLWVNMHGFFFLGPFVIWLMALCEWVKRRVPLPWEWNTSGHLTDQAFQRLTITGFAVLAACLFNPLMVKGAVYPLGVLFQLGGDSRIFFEHIVELQKPITAGTLWTEQYAFYKITILLSAYSFFLNRRRLDLTLLFVWLAFLFFSLSAIRNMVFFSFAAFVVFMHNTSGLGLKDVIPFKFSNEKFKDMTGLAAKILLMVWMLNFGLDFSANGYFDYDTFERKSEFFGVSKRSYPYKAVDFLVRNKVRGNFFNDFNSGAYLVGRTYPRVKVFIDGRTEVYGPKFFEEYQKIWKKGDQKVFAELAARHKITGAFLNSTYRQKIPEKVLKMFYSMKDWVVVYFDHDGVVFLKKTPPNKALISRTAIDLRAWKPKELDLLKLGSKRIDPYIFTNRAYTLDALGLSGPALKEAEAALKIAPDWIPSYRLLGKIYGQMNEHRKAFEYLRIAMMYAPHDVPTRANLALAYENLKDYKGEEEQYQRIIDDAPNDPKGYFGKSKALALQGKDRKALRMLKIARQMAPKDKIDVKKIHDIIGNHNLDKATKALLEEVAK